MDNQRLVAGARALMRPEAQPNVLSNAAEPNRLSTQSTGLAPNIPGRNQAPTGVVPQNRLLAPGSAARAAVPADTRFERPARRAPSLSRIIFIGFLLVTGFRLAGSLLGGLAPSQAVPTAAPQLVRGSDIEPGAVAFGIAADGTCGILGAGTLFNGATDVWWSANLDRGLVGASESLLVIEKRNGVVIEQAATSVSDLGRYGSSVVCAIKPVGHATVGTYVLQVWDAAQTQLLASGAYTIGG
jgi:hypothetical protein